MKIAIISDTHNLLREEVKLQLKDCDMILHAGDICSPAVYDALVASGKPMLVVRGNGDGRWAAEKGIPKVVDTCLSELEGWSVFWKDSKMQNLRIYMVHDRKDIPADILEGNGKCDLVVFGHSHKYESFYAGKTLVINPGSCGLVRFRLPVTMAVVEVSDSAERVSDKFYVRRIDFAQEKQAAEVSEVTPG
jgi:putative phosphoesterase